MKVPFNKINNIESLKSLGSYQRVKFLIGEIIGFPIKAKGWNNLFNFINNLSLAIDKNREPLNRLQDKKSLQKIGSFLEAKNKISGLLSLHIKARSWKQLETILNKIMFAFSEYGMVDRGAIFEKNKLRNFIHSSKLEGIEINYTPNLKMEDVLNKYRVKEN